MATSDHIFAARDPRGFRPLAMGRIPGKDGLPDSVVFASETCAFDLLGADYERDVKPGELVVVGPEGVHSHFYAPALAQSQCIFEQVYFARPDSLVFGKSVQESREQMGRQLAREAPVEADLVVGVPDSGLTAALGYARESGIPMQFGLVRNHYVGRTFIEPEQRVRDFGVRLKLNPVRQLLAGQAGDSDRRLDCARHHQPEDCAHGARCGRHRSSHADLVSAHDFAVLLRRGHAGAPPPDCGTQIGGRGAGVYRRRFAGLSFTGGTCVLPAANRRAIPTTARRATRASIRPIMWTCRDSPGGCVRQIRWLLRTVQTRAAEVAVAFFFAHCFS